MRRLLIAATALVMTAASPPRAPEPADPFIWLEEVDGARALAKVRGWNEATAALLAGTPEFEAVRARAAAILNDPRQIAYPQVQNDRVVNFWQDAAHVKGIWRTASLESFLAGRPVWRTLVDVDALARAEGRNWVWKGAVCLKPDYARCMIGLSDGGKDALVYREFDMASGAFVPGGFTAPEAKTTLAWLDRDTLLVQSDFGPGTLTDSGYGRQVRRWSRGTPLGEAGLVAEGTTGDVGVSPVVEWDGGRAWPMIDRSTSFWTSELSHLAADGRLVRSPLPDTAVPESVLGGRMIARLYEPWTTGGTTLPAGAIVSYPIAELEAGRPAPVESVYVPGARTAVADLRVGKDRLYLSTLEDVAGRLTALRRVGSGWEATSIPVPPYSAITMVDAADDRELMFVNIEGLTRPDSLVAITPDAPPRTVAALPAQFDAARLEVSQRFALSRDGTRVPYFLVRPKGAVGPLPTLLHAYGGFRLPSLPTYLTPLPQVWVEGGGAYVLANIRGGGEYGPAWHDAGLKANRQRVFDDFHAVAEALKAEGIASGVAASGRSNGGLLVGVAMTQRPDLYEAVLMGVPLADMRRFNRLLAGASWMAEYGNPDVAEEWAYISAYSPYHNLRGGVDYPTPMIFTSTKDDRVHPAHARKMAARMEQLGLPFHYYENTEGGHAGTADKMEEAYRVALLNAYLRRELGMAGGAAAAGR